MTTACEMDSHHVKDVARIHQESLADDYLPSLGKKFLEKVFYTGSLKSNNGTTLLIIEDGQVAGFVTIATDSSRFIRQIFFKNFFLGFILSVRRILSSIKTFQETIQLIITIFKQDEKTEKGKAELVFIAVDKTFRGKKIGKKLVRAASEHFSHFGIKKYTTKVLANNNIANNMYEKMGCKIINRFSLMNREWVIWELDVTNILEHTLDVNNNE